MPTLRLPMSADLAARWPRSSAFRYDYVDGQLILIPNARTLHARLDFMRRRPVTSAPDVELRPLGSENLDNLVPIFASAFADVQPFASIDDATRTEAARVCLTRTLIGNDGQFTAHASFAAWHEGRCVGAILITLLGDGDPFDARTYENTTSLPADLWDRHVGQPHLTWIFVEPNAKRRGVGGALLAKAIDVLQGHGYRYLLSTFLLGNETSMLWHWRSGFEVC